MFDPLKTATANQFSILNGLSDKQITDIATGSGFYQLFHQRGYSDAWIAADVVAWERFQQNVRFTLPLVVAAVYIVAMTSRYEPALNQRF